MENINTPNILTAKITNVTFGNNITIINPVNLYDCVIGDNVFIGPFVEIQRGVIIGKNCRIQSHSFICEMVKIFDDCFISHGVMFINDTFQNGGPSYNRSQWKPTIIKQNVYIGTNVTILPVTICSNVIIGAGSVVTKDIVKPGKYVGNPARML
jgi:acetyltransferase-like isoleucine patch superfamily enzyme